MVHGKNRIPYWIDRRLTGLVGPDYDAAISFGLPYEPEDSQYGESRSRPPDPLQRGQVPWASVMPSLTRPFTLVLGYHLFTGLK